MSVVDSSNRAHSIMGPECSYCSHRKGWHHDGVCSPWRECRCAEFDDGTKGTPKLRVMFSVAWHVLARRHVVDDLDIVTDDGTRRTYEFHAHCSCGREWS